MSRASFTPYFASAKRSTKGPTSVLEDIDGERLTNALDLVGDYELAEMMTKDEFFAGIGSYPAVECLRVYERAVGEKFAGSYSRVEKAMIMRAMYRTCQTYFVVSADANMLKIGQTKNLKKRLAALQGASPVPLEVRANVPFTERLEGALHEALAKHRHHGEWFVYSDELVELTMMARVLPPSKFLDLLFGQGLIPESVYLGKI